MDITEVRIKIVDEPAATDKLLGFCTLTFGTEFVVRDLKIINAPSGPFVAMPSRKLTDRCGLCGNKSHLRAKFCNECGGKLDAERASRDDRGRAKLHTDIAHPINSKTRQRVERTILDEYEKELKRSQQPGYRPPMLGADYDEPVASPRRRPRPIQHEREEGMGA